MKGVFRAGFAILAAVVLSRGFVPGAAFAQDETSFTPIIPGMKLLAKGTPAPPFKIFDIDGVEYDFPGQQEGNPYILVFFSIFCEPCREEMPVIEQMYQQYRDQNLQVLAISMDGPPFKEAIRNYINSEGYSFSFLLDEIGEEDFKTAGPYKIPGTPVLYLVDKDGNVFTGHLGRITPKELKALIDEMIQEG